jgi:hypothetical protein
LLLLLLCELHKGFEPCRYMDVVDAAVLLL